MIIILGLTVLFTMYLYGMVSIYFPKPIHLGAGQYIDIATGITLIGLFIFGIFLATQFKQKKR